MLANRILTGEKIATTCAQETEQAGRMLARALEQPMVIVLSGPLGAGKTQFVRGFAAEWGTSVVASSPSFALVHDYSGGRLPLFHLDFYRLHSQSEVWTLGWEDLLPGSVLLVEWGERFPDVLPRDTLQALFTLQENGSRVISIRSFFDDAKPC